MSFINLNAAGNFYCLTCFEAGRKSTRYFSKDGEVKFEPCRQCKTTKWQIFGYKDVLRMVEGRLEVGIRFEDSEGFLYGPGPLD